VNVVVVGAGPAGSAAAITLRQQGISVTVVERSPFPRDRPGETLHPGIEPLLERLGAHQSIHDADFLRHTGHWVEWVGPARFVQFGRDSNGPWKGFQALRRDFDSHLLAVAAEHGATILLGCAAFAPRVERGRVVAVATARGLLPADCTIDCTGDTQWLRRHLGIAKTYRSPQLLARYGYAAGEIAAAEALPRIRADARGWTWIAEVAPGRFQWTRVTRPRDRPPQRWVPDVLRHMASGPVRGADVTWRILRTTAGPGWFIAGDAAATLDPSSSHGVLRAIMTGMLAGNMAAQGLCRLDTQPECARAYDGWLAAWFAHDATVLARAYHEANLFGFGAPTVTTQRGLRR
jgi:flavin-dependent dehydrogenase